MSIYRIVGFCGAAISKIIMHNPRVRFIEYTIFHVNDGTTGTPKLFLCVNYQNIM